MKVTNLCYLIKEKNGKVTEVLLALKKRRFGAGFWNGVGGKVLGREKVTTSLLREAKEEIGVEPRKLKKVAIIQFVYPKEINFDQTVHVYFAKDWLGEPRENTDEESEGMRPKWFKTKKLPLRKMWPSDGYWLKHVLEGRRVRAKFIYTAERKLVDATVKLVTRLN